MTWYWPGREPVDRVRRGLHLAADIIAFVVESACVGNGVFWFVTWGMLSFDWDVTAREYGRFWTHYAKANPAARHPVELSALIILGVITVCVAFVRAPDARRARGVRRASWRARQGLHTLPANESRP
jgi:hypothetical protein